MVKPLSLSWSLLLKSLSWSLMKSPWFCPCVQCYIKGNYMQRNAELITITYLLAYTAYAHHICSVREYILYASYVRSSYQQKCSISYLPITLIGSSRISVATGGGQMGQLPPPTAARPDPEIRADPTRNVFRKNCGGGVGRLKASYTVSLHQWTTHETCERLPCPGWSNSVNCSENSDFSQL